MSIWLLENWGNLASAIGLLVSVIGFSIAVWQIVRTRQVAEAARTAANATRDSLNKNLTIDDLRRVSLAVQEIKNLHMDRHWRRAIDRYNDVRVALADVRSRHPSLSEEHQTTIQEAVQDLRDLENVVMSAMRDGKTPRNLGQYETRLLYAQTLIDELASNLKQSI